MECPLRAFGGPYDDVRGPWVAPPHTHTLWAVPDSHSRTRFPSTPGSLPSRIGQTTRTKAFRYDEKPMAKYLVTGIAGFIGSTIARRILAQGDDVRGVDNLATGNHQNIAEILDRVDFRQTDILDLDALHSACEGVDYVF